VIETTVENPEKHETVRADSQGRVSLGIEYADHDVELVVVDARESEAGSVQQAIADRPMEAHERTGMLFVRSFGIDPDSLRADHDAVTGPEGVDPDTVGVSDVDWSAGVIVDRRNVARFTFGGADAGQFPFSDEPTAEPVAVTTGDGGYDEPVYCYENEHGDVSAVAQSFVDDVGRVFGYDPTEELSHVRVHPEEGPYPVLFRDPAGDAHITVAPRVAD
jgi:hypothetical protein